jgi:hypothetical protein
LQLLGVALFGLLLAAARPALAQGLTYTTNTYSVGSSPFAVAVADVNGDGYPDLITANSTGNSLTVLTNNRAGIFGFNATLPVGADPVFVVAASINGSAKPALVSANANTSAGAGTLTVLTNNGSGVYGSNSALYAYGVSCLASADLYGNGRPDLIGNDGTLLLLYTNTGAGFGFPYSIGGGDGQVEYILAVDVNGDGSPDLVTANYDESAPSSTLTVLTNNGAGGFSIASTPAVGNQPQCVVAVDINGTGKVALVSANYGAQSLTVLTNGGLGQCGSNATINLAGSPTSIVSADFNGDGRPDLAVVENNNTLVVLTNNGGGGFGSNTVVNFNVSQQSLVTAKVNSSGLNDLITVNGTTPGVLTVLTQVGAGRPWLKITRPNLNAFLLTWVSSTTNFSLQTNNNLASTNWLPANLPVTSANGTNQSTLTSPPPGKLFFRLKQ